MLHATARRSTLSAALLVLALVASVLAVHPVAVAAVDDGPYLDQRVEPGTATDGALRECNATEFPGSASVVEAAQTQTFTPSRGELSSLELCMHNGTPADVTFQVVIFTTDSAGLPIAPSRATAQAVARPGTHWSPVEFTGEVSIAAGARYTIEVGPIGVGGVLEWRLSCQRAGLTAPCLTSDDAYPHGRASSVGPDTRADFGFRTYTPRISDLSATVIDHQRHLCPGLTSQVSVEVTNLASAGTEGSSTRDFSLAPYLSATADPGDLGSAVALGEPLEIEAVAPDSSRIETFDVQVPGTLPWDGPSFLLIDVDSQDVVHESPDPADPVEDQENITSVPTIVTVCGDPGVVSAIEQPTGVLHPGLSGVNLNWLLREHPGALVNAFANPASAPLDANPLDANPLDANPLDANPLDANPLDANPLDANPLDANPLDANPLDANPLDANPLDANPLDANPLDANAMQRAPLDANPLDANPLDANNFLATAPRAVLDAISLNSVDTRVQGGWDAILAGTGLDQQPLQSTTLGDLFALAPAQAPRLTDERTPVAGSSPTYYTHVTRVDPDGERGLQLRDVTLRGTPLEHLSLAALALGNTPLDQVTLRAEDGSQRPWCDVVTEQGNDCAALGIDTARDSLVTLELHGIDLARVNFDRITLDDVTFGGVAPAIDAYLPSQAVEDGDWQFKLQLTSLGEIRVSELSDATLVDCPTYDRTGGSGDPYPAPVPCGDADLATVALRGAFADLATVRDLLAALPASARSAVSIGQLVVGTIGDPMHFPWHTLDLGVLASLQPDGPALHVAVDLLGAGSFIDPVVTIDLPAGYAPVAATATAAHGSVVAVDHQVNGDGTSTVALHTTGFVPAATSSRVTLGISSPAALGSGVIAEAVTGPTVDSGPDGPVVGVFVSEGSTAEVDVVERLEPNDDHRSSIWFQDRGEVACAGAGASDCSTGGPILLRPNVLYASQVRSADDVDLFSLAVPDAVNSTVIVEVVPPAGSDLDVRVWAPGASPLKPNPLDANPLDANPLDANFGPSVVPNEPIGANEILDGRASETLSDAPLDANPLDANPLDANGFVSSQHRGDHLERVRVPVRRGDDGFYTIEVYGYNGAASELPYSLRVSVTGAPHLPGLELCQPRDFPYASTTTSTLPDPATADPETDTLVIVNLQRFERTFGAAETARLRAALDAFVAGDRVWDGSVWAPGPDTGVRGLVVPVEADPDVAAAYDAWDQEAGPCDPARANAVATAIRSRILEYRGALPGVSNVLLVGSDELLPMLRVADETTLANEQDFAGSAVHATDHDGAAGNALTWALASATYLTDDGYGATAAKPFLDHHVFVPDAAVGRLVDTPSTVVDAIRHFTATGGQLTPQVAAVTGYDFMADGAVAIAEGLDTSTGLTSTRRIDETWTRTDLRDVVPTQPGSILSPNGHADFWRLLPADQNATGSQDDEALFRTTRDGAPDDIATLGVGSIVASMGCHFGLNVPDTLGATAVHDWADAVAKRQGVLIAATGFQYADTETVAVGEELMARWAEQLDDTVSVGEAMAMAKALYLAEAGTYGVYDAKGTSEIVTYGIPNYRVAGVSTSGSTLQGTAAATASSATTSGGSSSVVDLSLGLQSAGTCVPGGNCLVARDGATGSYLEVEGPQGASPIAVDGMPVIPKLVYDIPPGDPVHGAVITELTSVAEDLTAFDPVFARSLVDASQTGYETQATDLVFPTRPATVTNVSTAAGRVQRLIMPSAMFSALDDARVVDGQVQGTLRVDTGATVELLRSTSDDVLEPRIRRVTADAIGGGLAITVEANDLDGVALEGAAPGEVARVVALYRTDDGSWSSVELSDDGERWTATVALPVGRDDVQMIVQAADAAGNVGYFANKGVPVRLAQPEVAVRVEGTPGERGWYRGPVTVTLPDDGYERSLDGGLTWQPVAPDGSFTVPGPGATAVVVRSRPGGTIVYRSTISIDGQAPSVSIVAPEETVAGDTTYRDGDVLTVEYACEDATSGVASCQGDVPNGATLVLREGTGSFTVTGRDVAGNVTTLTRTFHVARAPLVFEGFFSPAVDDDDDDDDQHMPEVDAGDDVVFTYRLYRGGAVVDDVTLANGFAWQQVDCRSGAVVGSPFQADVRGLTYWQPGRVHRLEVRTDKKWKDRCYRFTLTLGTGADRMQRSIVVEMDD